MRSIGFPWMSAGGGADPSSPYYGAIMVRFPVRPRAHGWTVTALIGTLAIVVFANSWGTFSTDIKPEVYLAPGRMLHEYVSAWTFSPYLGGPNFNAGLTPVVAVTALLSGLGLSPEMTFKTFHLMLWLIAAWGASHLGRRLDPTMGRRGGLVVAIVYVANPYAVTAGATLPILLPMAWLPWQLLTLVRASEEPGRWRWPALFGLTFFLMGGLNAGVVPVLGLLAVVPTMAYCRRRFELTRRQVVVIVARCAVFVVWLSLYWLVPALAATATGQAIVQGSETVEGIARVSSFAEVLRGLGLWPLYGASGGSPWVANHAVYLTSVVVVLATFVASALALLSLGDIPRRLARYLTGLILLAAIVMVGLYPPESPSPFGRLLAVMFDTVSPLSAFRTTNKIGAVLTLGFALAAGMVLRKWMSRVRPRLGRPVLLAAGGALVVMVSLPAFTGHLYISPLTIPSYWEQAASSLDEGDPNGRVLVLPGVVNPHYRWTADRPDDILNSLIDRPTFTPTTTPNTSPVAVNFTAALDDTFQSGTSQGPVTSAFARYLGARDILLRHDLVWEDQGGARPGLTQAVMNADDGLTPVRNYGEAGRNVRSPIVAPDGFSELMVPPLQRYDVQRAREIVRAEPVDDTVVVAGDGWAIPAMVRGEGLATSPSFRYAQDLDAQDWADVLGDGHRLVVTDTNRRRAAIPNRLVAGHGPLLSADDPLPAGSRTLGTNTDDQTVLDVEGGAVTATDRGYAFFDTPWGTAENAFDGDSRTSWVFGDFGRGAGQSIRVDLDTARSVPSIEIVESIRGPVRIGAVTVHAGDSRRTVALDDDGTTTVSLGLDPAASVTVTIDSLRGEGFNAVALAEIRVPEVSVARVARTPRTFDTAWASWGPATRAAFSATPLDVLLTRVQGGRGADDDEETALRRIFSLPDNRLFDVSATVRVASDAEAVYDQIEGIEAGATSSGRWFDQPQWRASGAFDGDSATGWAPDAIDGASITVTGPQREVAEITFDQTDLPGAKQTAWARQIRVLSDDVLVTTASVDPGANTIELDDGKPVDVADLTVEIVEADASTPGGSSPLVTEIGAGRTLDRQDDPSGCFVIGTVDGRRLPMRPLDAVSPAGSAWERCSGQSAALEAGVHEIDFSRPGVTVDTFDMADVRDSGSPAVPAPPVILERGFGASMTVRPFVSDRPYYLVIGEGYDERWTASVDGRDLGRPITLDGYSTAWLIGPGVTSPISVRFAPQTGTDVALASTGVGLLVAVGLGVAPWARRRSRVLDGFLAQAAARRRVAVNALTRTSTHLRLPRFRSARVTVRGVSVSPWLRRTVGWLAFIAAAAVFASWPGLVAAAAIATLNLIAGPLNRSLAPGRLIVVGAALVVAAGVVWVVSWGELRGSVTPRLVANDPWPNALAAAGLVAVVVGVWRRPDEPRSELPDRHA